MPPEDDEQQPKRVIPPLPGGAQQPQQQPGPTLSPDGRWRWDGTQWVSVDNGLLPPPPPATAAPKPRSALIRADRMLMRVLGGFIVALLIVSALAYSATVPSEDDTTAQEPFTEEMVDTGGIDCEALSESAVDISTEQDAEPRLLQVRAEKVVEDNLDSYEEPTGADEARLLVCEGVGIWNDNTRGPIRVTASVDAEGMFWIGYREIR